MATATEAVDVVILGAGAAGMMAAIEAGRRGRSVVVIDHADAPGEKIRISGGGRCNFTNIHAGPKNFLSENLHFCKSALARYRPEDFIALVRRHGIPFHEKALGQLFCDRSARDIITMLTTEMAAAGAEMRLATEIRSVSRPDDRFVVETSGSTLSAASLIVATGGKSIPKMGATGLAYRIAADFGLGVTETRPALVPLTLDPAELARCADLPGVSIEAVVRHGKTQFAEALLFTHRGLSGPAILQISSYWREGDDIAIDLAPGIDVLEALRKAKATAGRQHAQTVLADILPRRLAQHLALEAGLSSPLADCPDRVLAAFAGAIRQRIVRPAGSEGYRTAEVTLGGVSTADLDSKTMMARAVPGLYFIGECVDVTGWLGGYNFQWAWASGHVAGQCA